MKDADFLTTECEPHVPNTDQHGFWFSQKETKGAEVRGQRSTVRGLRAKVIAPRGPKAGELKAEKTGTHCTFDAARNEPPPESQRQLLRKGRLADGKLVCIEINPVKERGAETFSKARFGFEQFIITLSGGNKKVV